MSLKKHELIKWCKENIIQSRIIKILTVCISIIRKENLSFAMIERSYIIILWSYTKLKPVIFINSAMLGNLHVVRICKKGDFLKDVFTISRHMPNEIQPLSALAIVIAYSLHLEHSVFECLILKITDFRSLSTILKALQ